MYPKIRPKRKRQIVVDENPMVNQEYVSDVLQFKKMFCLGRCGRNGMEQ